MGIFHRKKKWQRVLKKVTGTTRNNTAMKTGATAMATAYRSPAVKTGMVALTRAYKPRVVKKGAAVLTGFATVTAVSAAVSSLRRKTES